MYIEDPIFTLNLEIFANCAKLYGNQSILIETMLKPLNKLVREHFKYQQQLMAHSVRPFLPKIDTATNRYTENLYKFIKKRETIKNDLKD